jgi:hypothetical protein
VGTGFPKKIMREKTTALPLSGRNRQGDAAKGVIFYPGDIDIRIMPGY